MGGASHNDNIVLVYAGGLHYKRYKTLRLLALAIRKFNLSPEVERKAQLRIYCNQKPTERERRAIELQGASNYCGALSSEELSDVLARSDILVHVESFDYNSIDKTRLSVSTKISEYMSLGKPILAIGPENIASMEVLSDVAFCITDTKQLNQKVSEFLLDDLLPASLALKALEMYEAKYLIANYDQYLLQMILGSSDTYQALEKQ
jgi:glycosyltransferase involved in cell wall biosynthesis